MKNPLLWTIQERMFCIGHYIAATQDGDPDFEIGNAHFSDYLQAEKHYQFDSYDLGEYEDDLWTAVPLLGVMAETIERLEGEIEGIENRTHWYLGCMACQLIPNGDALDYNSPDYDTQVLERMIVLSQVPESNFLYLMGLLTTAHQHFDHLFNISISDDGVVAMPREGVQTCRMHDFQLIPPSPHYRNSFVENLTYLAHNLSPIFIHKSYGCFQHDPNPGRAIFLEGKAFGGLEQREGIRAKVAGCFRRAFKRRDPSLWSDC